LGCGGAGATHCAFGEAETLLDRRGQLADAAAVAGRQAARKAPVIAVNNKDKALRVLKVVAPQGADLVQATHVPNSAADALVPDNETSTKKAGSRRVPLSLSACAWKRLSIPGVIPTSSAARPYLPRTGSRETSGS
jgi:hypothetical protein